MTCEINICPVDSAECLQPCLETTTAPTIPFILAITFPIDGSYLQSLDGISQISLTINAPSNDYSDAAAHAL
jgi:hypothetical protein